MDFDVVIKNGRIWNGEFFYAELQDVAIREGKIVEIGKHLDATPLCFDAQGAIVSCGLIDLHMHIRGCCNDVYGIPAEMTCFPFGVTTAVEAWTDKDGAAILDNMLLDTFVFVGVNVKDNHADFTDTERLIDRYKSRVLGLKICLDTSNPAIVDETPLQEICEYARERGLRVLVHSTGSPVSMQRLFEILSEDDICTHVFHGGVNNVSQDGYQCLAFAKKKGIVLDNGMAGGVHTDFAVARGAVERGIFADTISTDITRMSAFVRGGNYGMTLCMGIMRSLGMSEEEIFKAVTSSPARILKRENALGILNVGCKADIAVIRYGYSPFEIRDRQGNCVKDDYGYANVLTLKNGSVVYRSNI